MQLPPSPYGHVAWGLGGDGSLVQRQPVYNVRCRTSNHGGLQPSLQFSKDVLHPVHSFGQLGNST
eukprot:4451562-Heterocapsa_arctica.AAC.1